MSLTGRAVGIGAGVVGVAIGASALAFQRAQQQSEASQLSEPGSGAAVGRPDVSGETAPGPTAEVPVPGVENPDLLFGGDHDAQDGLKFGTLRGTVLNVVTDDGVDLHVEVDEPDPALADEALADLTVVFAHGFTLNQDAWHFQRKHLRGRVRTVFYDQRSHGRSARAEASNSTIEQLGRDLQRVIETAAPGPVVVVGHSMGGMSVVSMVAQFPELIGEKVVGVGLVATTAGGLDPGRILFPLAPLGAVGAGAISRTVRFLDKGHTLVDRFRGAGFQLARRITDRYSFGDAVPRSWAEFVFDMIDATPFEVVAAFYPGFASLDHFDDLEILAGVPVTVIGATEDKLTGIGHQRKLHARIPGSELYEAHGAGHMVLMERHHDVNRELDHLIVRALAVVQEAPREPVPVQISHGRTKKRDNGGGQRPGRAG